MSKAKPVTLDAISKLLDDKLEKRFAENNKLVFSVMDEKLSQNNNRIFTEMDRKFAKMDKRFDEVLDTVRDFVGGVYDSLDKRVQKLETAVFHTN